MTDGERGAELSQETIEDLEAPAAAQEVAGGANTCATPTCTGGTKVKTYCERPTCTLTAFNCNDNTGTVIVYAQ
jgi:hypothetical protein